MPLSVYMTTNFVFVSAAFVITFTVYKSTFLAYHTTFFPAANTITIETRSMEHRQPARNHITCLA